MHHIFIVSKPVINKSNRSADLLLKDPLAFDKPLRLQTSEPKPRDQLYENTLEKDSIAKPIKENKPMKKTRKKNITLEKYDEVKLA